VVAPFIVFEYKLDRWDELIRNAKPAVSQIVRKVAADGYAASQVTVPVRRPDVETRTKTTGGALKNSGQLDMRPGEVEATISYTMYYAGYVHEGTVHMEGRPFLRDAIEALAPQMYQAMMILESRLLP